MPPEINYAAVFVLALANVALGAAWYSRAAFGRIWMELTGAAPEDVAFRSAKRGYGIAFCAALARTIVLAWIIVYAGSDGFGDGAKWGLAVGLGIIALNLASIYYFELRPRRLWLIDAGLPVVGSALTGAILAIW